MWIALLVILQSVLVKTPPLTGVLSTLQAAMRTHGPLVVGHIAIAVAYLVWRSYLFSGQATAVYASVPEYRVLPLLSRVLSQLGFPAGLTSLAPTAATLSLIGVLFVPYALRWGRRTAAFTGFVMALLIVIAVAIYVASPAGSGEGYRFYYLATVGIALIVAAALKTSSKSVMVILAVFMIALALWQSSAAAEWTRASRVVEGASRAMTSEATTLAPSEFGLVLLPDMMGHVPVARNAQGALLTAGLPHATSSLSLPHHNSRNGIS